MLNAYKCVEKIDYVHQKTNITMKLYDEEKLYLTIHIHRVV